MGGPKFVRYICERYPCVSEVVKEYQIPDFDNLYLDMNGIIHTCSHPDDDDPQLRLTQEKVFRDIFHLIEDLFRIIRPQKIFFMAIDGVAPRAKMNQQRSRRFLTAKDAERVIAMAREREHVLPDEEPFDSNCITPGTEFMARLHEHLKYFIVDKISNDPLWQNCKIIFSGHETPGEGKHKIMDYIRYLRAQPGYDPNTRHCLYGLDADLIMLGLCTHDPRFTLLREEVKFGKKNSKPQHIPEELTFYLLHLSLMREYLEQEFIQLKDKLPFEFDLEKIIDDWVLMGFLLGNDFIPHLPNMHIDNGSLQLLYNTYNDLLPTLDGYINESGTLNLARFEKFLLALGAVDFDLEEWTNDKFSIGQKSTAQMASDVADLINPTKRMFIERSEENVAKPTTDEINHHKVETCDNNDDLHENEFQQYKRDYYMNKLEFSQVTPEILNDQAEGYIRAIQWILNYYYNGVCSWSWFYPHHYAPFITDIKNFKDMTIDFDLGTPFTPFEQLLAVLPTASKKLLPTCYHKLMHDESSPIKDFYPDEFITDINGKKHDWETIVLIPFVHEKRLLSAMEPYNSLLTVEEKTRNTHGPMFSYEFTKKDLGHYAAPEFFPIVQHSHAMRTDIFIQDIKVERMVKGAYPRALLDIYYPGFPTLQHLNIKNKLHKGNVKVFEQPSRSENMFVQLEAKASNDVKEVANRILGQIVFVNWPHLQEALVTSVSSPTETYNANSHESEENPETVRQKWEYKAKEIAERHHNRLGIDIGDTKILVYVKLMTGRKYVFPTQGGITLEKQWAVATSVIPWQTVVTDVATYNPTFPQYQSIDDIYSVNSTCYFLGLPYYGYQAIVQDIETTRKGRVEILVNVTNEPNLDKAIQVSKELQTSYKQVCNVIINCGLTERVISQITGCLLISMGPKRAGFNDDVPKQDIGLNLIFIATDEEIPGYTTKESSTWLYSQKAINLVADYQSAFPALFAYLHAHGGHDHNECDIFPKDNGSGESVRKILSWLKKQPHYTIEKRTCGSRSLKPEVVKLIEASVDAYKQNVVSETHTVRVRPNLLYKPGLCIGNIPPDSKATYHLYDRVVNVRENWTVPLGYSGTIIAIHAAQSGKVDDDLYDVVFDTPFVGGLALNCSQHRGYRMSRLAIINKSYGSNELKKKTGKQWTDTTSVIQPLPTVVTNVATYDPTFEHIYPVNSKCYFLGLPYYGYQAIVQNIETKRKGRVKISLNVTNEPNFDKVKQASKELQTTYMQVHDIVRNCGLTMRVFAQITGCLLISMGPKRAGFNYCPPKRNIGLNLKFNATMEEIPGYTTNKSFSWLYSQKAINLVLAYQSAFPVLFAYLHAHGGHDCHECDIFPEDNGSGESVSKILSWLQKQPHYNIEKQACGSQSLERKVVELIETSVDAYKQNVVSKTVTFHVRPNLLYMPGLYMENIPPDCKATYHLYDRVVNVSVNFTVPLGYSGTIIAIHAAQSGKVDDQFYDVVFDTPFVGGVALNCSQHRGYRMSHLSLINKTYGLNELLHRTGHHF